MNFTKKNIVHILFILTITIVLLAFTSPAISKPVTIKMCDIDPAFLLTLNKTNGEFASTNIKSQAFKKYIESMTGGKYEVKIFPNGQLGGQTVMLELNSEGTVQLTGCSASPIGNFAPELMAFQIPFIFKDVNVAMKVMNGPVGEELNELIVKRRGIRYLYWGFEGFFNIGNKKRPILVPSDLKGMKLRCSTDAITTQILKFAGATPTPMPFGEIYTGIQQGVVDGAFTSIGLHAAIKLEELEKYMSMADLFFGWSPISINEKFYRSLSPHEQWLFKKAAVKAIKTHLGMYFWGRDLWIESFRKKGVKVSIPTPEQKAEWVKAIKEPMEKWVRGKIGDEWVDKVIKASKKAEKELYGDIK